MKFSVPKLMKAVFLDSTGKLIMKTVPVPEPGSGEVLVKMSAAPVNPSDIARIKDFSSNPEVSSFIPGLEGSGTVVAAGKGLVPGLWLGKRVSCSSKHMWSGTWAEYMVTAAFRCFPLGKGISDEQGSMSLVNPMTALAFFDIIKSHHHKAIVSTAAAGALGRMIEYLGNKNRIPVINIVRNDQQAGLLRSKGSKYVLNSSEANFPEQLFALSHELNATLVLDAVGGIQSKLLLENIPYGSEMIIYGNLSGEDRLDLNPRKLLISENKKIHGFFLGNWAEENGTLKTVQNIIKVKRLLKNEISIIVQDRFPLDKAQTAVDSYLQNMTAGKVLIIP